MWFLCLKERGLVELHTLRSEGLKHPRERQTQYRGPEIIGCDSPRHSNFTMRQRENLRRVGEGHGAFSWGVKRIEEIDEEGNHAQVCIRRFWDPEAETSSEKSPIATVSISMGQGKAFWTHQAI